MASQASENRISAGDRTLSREKLLALSLLRHTVLGEIRTVLSERLGYLEATPSTLVNIAGSCENPHTSFKVDYYGRPAYLSQSAQLQLEALVLRLQRGFFTANNSFREEHFDDPETPGRRLSEFTLIEAEKPVGEYAGEIIVEENQRKKKLEDLLSVMIGIGGLGIGIFFLSNNITGNVIGNMTNSTSNIIGVGLLVIGLVAGFFWVKRR